MVSFFETMRSRTSMTVFLIAAISALAFPASASLGVQSRLGAGDHTFSIRHDGRARRYIAHVPSGARSVALPVMIAYHGGGGEAQGFKDYAGLDVVADREHFIVVYPNGTGLLPNRLLTFNGGGCCGYAKENNVDDVGFTMAMLDDLAKRTRIDRNRIYATGHSNGAIMAYRLAAERANEIAAIVPVAGAMSVDRFAPARPVAVLDIHSVDDPRALYDGGIGPPFPGTNHRETHQPVQKGLDQWIRTDGCNPTPTTTETRRGKPRAADASHTATKLVWAGCKGNVEIVHWKITGAGHMWPGGGRGGLAEALVGPATSVIDAAEEAWKFASRFHLR
ncbi:MAG TPA: PHB depolymerase family esterase [Terriglobia bacterium]|nr:PHB depolymerase family esterase [Terriglobia bacterium]